MIIKFLVAHMDFKEGEVVDFENNKAQAEYFISMKVAEETIVEEKQKDKKEKK
jgi:hypothetical protein